MSTMDFLAVLPDLVRGSPDTEVDNLNAAIGPIASLTDSINSLPISSSDRVQSEENNHLKDIRYLKSGLCCALYCSPHFHSRLLSYE